MKARAGESQMKHLILTGIFLFFISRPCWSIFFISTTKSSKYSFKLFGFPIPKYTPITNGSASIWSILAKIGQNSFLELLYNVLANHQSLYSNLYKLVSHRYYLKYFLKVEIRRCANIHYYFPMIL